MSENTAHWPTIKVTLDPAGRAEIDRLGTVHTLIEADPEQARRAVTSWIAANIAAPLGRPVPVTVIDPTGRWHLAISPDETVQPSTHGKDRAARRRSEARTPATGARAASFPTTVEETPAQPQPQPQAPDETAHEDQPEPDQEPTPMTLPDAAADPHPAATPAVDDPDHTAGARHPAAAPRSRHSFLDDTRRVETPESGWRAFLARLGFTVSPSATELARRQDERAISRHWAGPRTIAIVNGKGGAGKTPATVILSALFARHGGSGVLAWDNNETRGTLGWRTEQGTHEAHVLDLLPHAEDLMAPTARASDLAAFVHHQIDDKYDVLRSNPEMLAAEQRLTADHFDAVHRVATKYFRLILVDSGNDESAPNWLRMIDQADQIVVATTTRPDHAEAGILLLDALRDRDAHGRHLADNAVVIVSQADKEEAAADRIAEGYDGAARAAVTIPYDQAMRSGWLQFDRLHPATRRAYLRAAAAVSDGL